MRVTTCAPSASLARLVSALDVVETDEGVSRVLLPETGVIVGFRYAGDSSLDGSSRLPWAVVTGLRASVRSMHTAARSGIVLARIRPAAAAALLRVPAHELFGASCALADVVGRERVEQAAEQVASARTAAGRVAAVERFVLSLADPDRRDPLMAHAAHVLDQEPATRIGPLAARLGLSRDAFAKRFRRVVGATPRDFVAVVRFRRAVAAHRAGASLAGVARAAGFYDQSHLVRSFRTITGQAPGQFLTHTPYG